MRAEIITIGTELLQGDVVDTNSLFLSEDLARLGVTLLYKTTVGDHEEQLDEVLKEAFRRVQLIITTGGLGPTEDDVTKKVITRALGRRLIFREDLQKKILERYAVAQRMAPRHIDRQAVVPAGAIIVDNPVGTAPGFILEYDKGHIVSLPGVPHEMKAMFRETVFDWIRKWVGGYGVIRLRVLRTFGLMEPQINEALADMMGTDKEPYVGLSVKETGVDIRINASGKNDEESARLIEMTEIRIRSRLGDVIYGADCQTMEEIVGGLLREKGMRIAVAESCTGGLIGHRLTNVPGSSDYFDRGVVCYSNDSKTSLLGVPGDVIADQGAVSAAAAKAMADGIRRTSGADFGIGVTGIAGPGGGVEHKPVGLVYMAFSSVRGTESREFVFSGTREAIKLKASQAALNGLRQILLRGAGA
jgi:nicotinamide-nucleotide amidase